ncbi:MAG: peptidylprolyl isomerase [Chitinophagia bacterium]|jgi:peptidyl-prolyl cis-trans isomerase SurA|nr:peptidylprolyl isomerase [Chitinophagia bacterium]NCA29942.1 peptidylprolyl isomerase [Chitinophagia bacterium]
MKLISIAFSIFCLTISYTAKAQVKKVLADKIIATVGDKFILKSDVENAIGDYKRQAQGQENVNIPSECQVVEGQLIRKALVLQALIDSINVTEDEVEVAMEGRIRNFIQQFGSKEVLEEVAGRSVFQLKEDFRLLIKEQKLADEMQSKIVEKIKITPTEVRNYYNKIPVDSLPLYESEVQVTELVMHPKANRDVEEYVIKQMLEYRKQIESGANKFDQLVKLYSEDPSAKENLGLFNLNRNEKNFDPAFMAGSFRLKEGQISAPIKSKFGYHIIQLISRSGDEAVVKHILRIPPITNDEINETKVFLDSIRKEIIAGRMSFGEAVNKYSDDDGSKFSGGAITGRDGSTYVNIDQLDKEMVVLMKNMKPGDISTPQVYLDDRGRKTVRLIYFKERTTPHRENLKEDYNKVAQRALEEKKAKSMEAWFKEHVPNYYVFIDDSFQGCAELKDWTKVANQIVKEKAF